MSIGRNTRHSRGWLLFLAAGALTASAACVPVPRCAPVEMANAWEQSLKAAWREGPAEDMLALYRQRQRTGDPQTVFFLGLLVGIGLGEYPGLAERNHTALILTKRAALCGDFRAIEWLSQIYEKGILGVTPRPEAAACLKTLREEHFGESAAQCGVELYAPEEISDPYWDAQEYHRRLGHRHDN